MRRLAWLARIGPAALSAACFLTGGDPETASPAATSSPSLSQTPTPTDAPLDPALGTLLRGEGFTDAAGPPPTTPTPSSAATPSATAPPGDAPTPGIASPTPPTPSPTAAPTEAPTAPAITPTSAPQWTPTTWQAQVSIEALDLPGDLSCAVTYAERGSPTTGTCEGCDFSFQVTRTLTASDGQCEWPTTESFELAFFLDDSRVDRLFPAQTEEEVDVWRPWYVITSAAAQGTADDPGSWRTVYTFQGHPEAGFGQPLGRTR